MATGPDTNDETAARLINRVLMQLEHDMNTLWTAAERMPDGTPANKLLWAGFKALRFSAKALLMLLGPNADLTPEQVERMVAERED